VKSIPFVLIGILIIGSIGILSFDNAFAQYTGNVGSENESNREPFIKTDRDSFTPNLDIILFGNVGDLELPITLEVSCDEMPNSLRYIRIYGGEHQSFQVDESGYFRSSLRTLEFTCDRQISTVTAIIQGTDASTSFQIIEWDENFKSVISASTDKTSYQKGDSVIFSGKVTNYEFGKTVSYVMDDPEGYYLSMGQILPKSDGSFSRSFESDWGLWRLDGNYVIKYRYADDLSTKSKATYYYSIPDPAEPTPTPEPEPTPESSTPESPYESDPEEIGLIDEQNAQGFVSTTVRSDGKIPDWVRNNAERWGAGQIADSDFTKGIGHLIENDIITISDVPQLTNYSDEGIPDWVRSNASWWASGLITEDDFVKGIEFLIEHGIIRI